MKNNYVVEMNENKEMCKKCGGFCCKNHPCDVSPYDIFRDKEPSVERLKEFLSSDLYQIDWWEGDTEEENKFSRIYIITPRVILTNKTDMLLMLLISGDSNNLYYPSYGGRCIFLTDEGCRLSWDDRPTGGKALSCYAPHQMNYDIIYDKEQSAKEWRKYQWLFEHVENRELKPIEEVLKNNFKEEL